MDAYQQAEANERFAALMTPQGRVDPYPTYAALRRSGPVVRLHPGFYLATGYAAIDEMLRDQRLLTSDLELFAPAVRDAVLGRARASFAASMIQTDGAPHARVRRLAASVFTPRRVDGLRSTIAGLAGSLIEDLVLAAGSGPVDFMSVVAYPLPVRVICWLLGVPAADREWFRERASAMTAILEPTLFDEQLPDADAAVVQLEEYFADLVARRRREPRDDLTTALVQATLHEPAGTGRGVARLSGVELLANLILLLVAGFETTTYLLGNGLYALLRHPDLAARLRADPKLAERFVNEILRLDSPVQITLRWTPRPVTVAGETIEEDGRIMLLLGAGNHDPARFADPEVFDPNRQSVAPLSFGGGIHYCLGAPLARLEAQVLFPLLLARVPDLALAAEPVRRDRLTLRGYRSLLVDSGRPGRG
jgi:cytochrome P450